MPTEKPKCFIIMPISTPENHLENYGNDKEHFKHVYECLFSHTSQNAGFIQIPPESKGSEVIHAEIIKHLSTADLVLCDMSILNPNVFFEFGIRTALNKPVALVVDEKTEYIPFDTGIINYITYDSSLVDWLQKEQIEKLTNHIRESFVKSNQKNTLWKYFGIAQPGEFKSAQPSPEDKLDYIIEQIKNLYAIVRESPKTSSEYSKDRLRRNITAHQMTSMAELLAVQKLAQEFKDAQINVPKIVQEYEDA